MTLYIIGGIILLLLFSGRSKVKQETIQADDGALLQSALEQDDIGALLTENEGPTIFVVPAGDSELTKEQRIAIIQNSTASYSAQIALITDKLAIDAAEAMDLIALTIFRSCEPGQEWTQKAFDLYMNLVNIWLEIYVNVNVGVSNAVAATMESAGYAIDNANECVQTAFVADITETSTVVQEQMSTVTVRSNATNGFLGIGAMESTGKQIVTESITTRNDTRNIVYVPHCVNYEVDPVAVDAILASQTLALQALYGQISAALALAPNPLQLARNSSEPFQPVLETEEPLLGSETNAEGTIY